MQTLCRYANAFAFKLPAFDDGIAAAFNSGLAVFAADMAVAVGGFVAVAVTFAVVCSGCEAETDAFVDGDGDSGIKACGFVFAAFLMRLAGGFNLNGIFCFEECSPAAVHIGAGNRNVGVFACA